MDAIDLQQSWIASAMFAIHRRLKQRENVLPATMGWIVDL
jgi:hypothetical protein